MNCLGCQRNLTREAAADALEQAYMKFKVDRPYSEVIQAINWAMQAVLKAEQAQILVDKDVAESLAKDNAAWDAMSEEERAYATH